MLRKQIYNNIVKAFTLKYSWLGAQFSQEFLLSTASWNIQQFSNPEFRIRRHLLLFWAPGWFKCQEENQKVLTNKGYQKISDLKQSSSLITLNKRYKKQDAKYHLSPKFEEKCVWVESIAGYNTKCGFEHPFLVIRPDGNIKWVKSKNLKKNDVLIMAKPKVVTSLKTSEKERARLVGYIIGDGTYTTMKRVGFANSNDEIIADYLKLAKKYLTNEKPKIYERKGSKCIWFNKAVREKLAIKFGLECKGSRAKVIPKQFMTLDADIIEEMLFGLYQSDGSVRSNGIVFNSTSDELMNQMQELLLLLGVNSHRIRYNLRVQGYENLAKLPLICNYSKHKEKIQKILNRRNNSTNLIPHGSKIILRRLKKRKGQGYINSIRKQFRRQELYRTNFTSKSAKNKIYYLKVCSKFNLPELEWLASPDIFFDKVREVSRIGKQTCYDIFVPQFDQYISQGFLTHNSSLLYKAHKIIGPELSTCMTDVTPAALRGTVEAGQFISPFTLKRPISICTEFGQMMTGSDTSETVQKLLNILEEGVVTVSLAKIAYLAPHQREQAKEDYGITFIDRNTFTYNTNWILIAGTYNKKFLIDNALESRFFIMYPEKKLDSSLTEYVVNSGPFHVDEETLSAFRNELLSPNKVDCRIKLPKEVYKEAGITPRECSMLISYILCRSWWNIKTSKDEIIEMARKLKDSHDKVWKTADDKVFDAIEYDWKTAKQVADEIEMTTRQVYYSLRKLRASRRIDDEGNAVWGMM